MAKDKQQKAKKNKPTKTLKKNVVRRQEKPKNTLRKRTTKKILQRARPLLKDKSLDAVSMQLQRLEKQLGTFHQQITGVEKLISSNMEIKVEGVERKLESRIAHFDERIDEMSVQLRNLEDKIQDGEAKSFPDDITR